MLLEQNYRSTQTILDAANGLIAHNVDQKPKHLWTDGGARRARSWSASSTTSTPRPATSPRRSTGSSRRARRATEIAVFYRVNAQSRVLEDTLVRFEIPYQVIGGTKFYERAEIKDAVAYLQLLANPADAISFSRIVNSPRRGIGQQTQARMLSHANTIGVDVLGRARASRRRSRRSGPAALKAVDRFAETMAALRQRAERRRPGGRAARGDPARDRLHRGARGRADGRGRGPDREPRGAGRRRGRVRRQPRARGRVRGIAPLEEFLAQISLVTEQDDLRDEESLATLMTLHNAKGLEYEAVFVIGCEEGVFPHSRSLEEGNVEEERRLCYVGVTRARERL